MELCEVFARCGLDVTLIAVINTAISLVLRHYIKSSKPRLYTALTYIVGAVIYAVYASVAAGDAAYAFENFSVTLQKGVTIGTLTMLLCAAFDRFTGGGTSGGNGAEAVIVSLLDGVVEEDKTNCAKDILEKAATLSGKELDEAVKTVIESFGGTCDGVTEIIISRTAERLAGADGAQTD